MDYKEEFKEMSPYNDNEVSVVVKRLIKCPEFFSILKFVYPGRNITNVLNEFKQIKKVDEFQTLFSSYAVSQIINKTSDGLTYNGLDNLEKNKSYLFIANHRDIVMDSAIMLWLLKENNYRKVQITFGSNLMSSQFIIDLGKLNKMFTLYRGGTRREIYFHALLHSAYIKEVLLNRKESVWIAQRDGRTKDGNDHVQSALLKMLLIKQTDLFSKLQELNIVPATISYEIEPCDVSKIKEKYITNVCKKEYIKSEKEDFTSVINGIVSPKGKINISIGKPLNIFLNEHSELTDLPLDELVNTVCEYMDKQGYLNYKLYPFNFIAYDRLAGTNDFLNKKYTTEDINKFDNLLKNKKKSSEIIDPVFEKMFLEMYSAPVKNLKKVQDF